MTGAWRFDPFTRIQRWVGEFDEPTALELAEYPYGEPADGTPRKPIKHGTSTGYKQHRYRGQIACSRCRAANAADSAERKARRKSTNTQMKEAS
jgi:hypothetical protein